MGFFKETDKAALVSWRYWFSVALQTSAMLLIIKAITVLSAPDCLTWRIFGYGAGLFLAGVVVAFVAIGIRASLYDQIDRKYAHS